MKPDPAIISGQSATWPQEHNVEGRIVVTDKAISAFDMKMLRTAKALICRPNKISSHALFIAHQLGIPLVKYTGQWPEPGKYLSLTIERQEDGYGLGTEAVTAEQTATIRDYLYHEQGIDLNMVVGVTQDSLTPVGNSTLGKMKLLFCSEQIYALHGINPFIVQPALVADILRTTLSELHNKGYRVIFRTADVDPFEFGEDITSDERGLRRLLTRPEILETEISAACAYGLPICLSFVRTEDEWNRAITFIRSIDKSATAGLMIETPNIAARVEHLQYMQFALLGLGDLKALLMGTIRDGWVHLVQNECNELREYINSIDQCLRKLGVEFTVPLVSSLFDGDRWTGPENVYLRDLGQIFLLEEGMNEKVRFREAAEQYHYTLQCI